MSVKTMMDPKSSTTSLIFLSLFLFLYPGASHAFNITKMLAQYPDFSSFNDQLTQTQLADQINSRKTITVLAIDNAAMSPLSGKPADTIKKILSLHVVLDYFDVAKLQKLNNKTAILTTLFQSSGQAVGQLGFLNVTHLSTGSVAIGSAVPGSSLGSTLVKSVLAQPYNISVLQISTVIMPSGIVGNSTSKSPSSAPATSPAKSPTSSNAPAPSVAAPAPAKAPASDVAPSPSDAADAPTSADTPEGASPTPGVADGPAADTPTDHTPEADSSGVAAGCGIHGLAFLMMILSSIWSLTSMV